PRGARIRDRRGGRRAAPGARRRRRRGRGDAGASSAPTSHPRITMATTAEWICTRCGSTNRALVPDAATRATDECVTCHARHALDRVARPVLWGAPPPGERQAAWPATRPPI